MTKISNSSVQIWQFCFDGSRDNTQKCLTCKQNMLEREGEEKTRRENFNLEGITEIVGLAIKLSNKSKKDSVM